MALSLYNDPVGPDKAINICIETMRKIYYGFSNRDKRKLNHHSELVSIEELYELTGDYSTQLIEDFDTIYDNSFDNLFVHLEIKKLISNGKLPEAIIVNTICFDDSCSMEFKNNSWYSYFNERKFIANLHTLNDTFVNYFSKTYNVDKEVIKDCLKAINDLSQYKLHKLINRTLYTLKIGGWDK